jgi:tripartite-type tricarboxylate transporter receptor subunit TctC
MSRRPPSEWRLSRRQCMAALACPWLGLGAAASAAPARKDVFPRQAVRIVVPYSVGIGPDVVARSVAEQLSQRWSHPVIVDNKPGASGIIAFGDVRRTAPDGHTLFLADTATLAVNPLLHQKLPYDPHRDLTPLTMLFRATFLLWVGGDNRFRTLGDLIEQAQRAPGRVSYATLGNGHASHVAVETFARAAGVQMLHVPFKDTGMLFNAVASSDVDFTAIGMNTAAGLYARGKLRPLAVAARTRLASHPDIPTLGEAGGPPVEMHPWAALMAVAGTPAPLLQRLRQDLLQVMATPEVRGQAGRAGFEMTPSTPEAVRARIESDTALYRPLVDEGRVARL